MNVIRARKAGFCFGVALALRKLDALVRESDSRVATFGEIIHNPQVLQEYASLGVLCLMDPAEAEGDMAVLIRAHGIPRGVEEDLRRRSSFVQDATCPRVKNAQLAIAESTRAGRELFLYGEEDHPEVRGLISYAAGRSHIFSTPEELERLARECEHDDCEIVLAAQTTQDRMLFDRMRLFMQRTFGSRLLVLDTICDATRQRQEEASAIAEQVQAMVVVGGRTSGNTRRLAELAEGKGIPTILVETADELEPAFFRSVSVAGLTAGASTPGKVIDAVEARLRSM